MLSVLLFPVREKMLMTEIISARKHSRCRNMLRQQLWVPVVALWILPTAGSSCTMGVWWNFCFSSLVQRFSHLRDSLKKQSRDLNIIFYQHFTPGLWQDQTQWIVSGKFIYCRSVLPANWHVCNRSNLIFKLMTCKLNLNTLWESFRHFDEFQAIFFLPL